MVDLAMSIFEFLTKFLVFWHPWHPWVCIRSVCWKWNLKQIEAIPPSMDGAFMEKVSCIQDIFSIQAPAVSTRYVQKEKSGF